MPTVKDGTTRLFKSDFLEFLTRTNPTMSIVTYGSLIVATTYLGYYFQVVDTFLNGVLIFLSGILTWTFMEYVLHRFMGHLGDYIPNSERAKKIAHLIHGIHHEYPKDADRLLMPPTPGFIIAGILFGFYFIFLREYTLLFFPGLVLGYLLYSFVHYTIHRFKPIKPFRYLWKHHSLHHYQYPNKAFGVSTPFWDIVFRTMPPRSKDK